MVCPNGQGGWGSAKILRTRGEGGKFLAILCGHLFRMAPYYEFRTLMSLCLYDCGVFIEFEYSVSRKEEDQLTY